MKPLKQTAMPLWESLGDVISDIKKTLKVFFKGSGKDAKTWGGIIGQTVGVTVIGTLILLITILGAVVDSFIWVGKAIGWTASKVVQGFTWILNKARAVASFVSGTLAAAWNGLKSIATTALNAIKTPLTTIWNKMSGLANLVKVTLVGAFNTFKTAAVKAVNAVLGPIKATVRWVNSLIAKLKSVPGLKRLAGGAKKPGQFGPLPVEPGPTPPTISAGPAILPDINVTGGTSEMVVHTHIILDGREVAISVERFKTERKVRATALTPGELREFVQATAIA